MHDLLQMWMQAKKENSSELGGLYAIPKHDFSQFSDG